MGGGSMAAAVVPFSAVPSSVWGEPFSAPSTLHCFEHAIWPNARSVATDDRCAPQLDRIMPESAGAAWIARWVMAS